jgi:hypothetical protein
MAIRLATLLGVILTAVVPEGRASQPSTGLPVTGQVVELSPFMVPWERIPWRYEALPGYEILSCYPDSVTREFIQGLDHARRLVHLFVPDALLASFDVPRAMILSNPDYMSSLSQDMLRDDGRGEDWPGPGVRQATGAQVFPNMELDDPDRTVAFVSRLDRTFQPASEKMGDGSLRYMLERRTPAPPPWFVDGIMNLYSGVTAVTVNTGMTNTGGVHAGPSTGPRVYTMNEMDSLSREDARPRTDGSYSGVVSYRIPPFIWLSAEDTRMLSPRHDDFCPSGADKAAVMRELLAADPPEDPVARQIWGSRSTLFVRWGLYGDRPGRRAFWEFVARAAAEPVTESLFRQYFGMSFAAAASQLNEYLPDAVEEPIDLQLEKGPGLPPNRLRPATAAEVARMKGDWERLVLGHVRQSYSDNASGYIKRELIQACAHSPGDSRLLSVLGLFDCDIGVGPEGAPFLEAAVKANVAGPRAYFRLAEMRYEKIQGSGDRRLGSAETASVIEPLEAGCRQSPALREAYELMGKVWSHSEARLSRQQLAFFDAGLEKFPKDMDLLYQAAVLGFANGYRSEAAAQAKRGLELSSSALDRDRFTKLLAEADKPAAAG